MNTWKTPLAAALAALALPALSVAETVSGAVEFTGTPPVMEKLKRESDPFCGKTPMSDEAVIVKDKKLVNVWVHVVKGAPDTKAAADAPAIMVGQQNCMYKPRVQAAVVGQKITGKNSDPILHNVHTYLGAATLFNKGMPNASAKAIEYVADKPGLMKWKCDVHSWMRGYVGVNKNAFQAVTGDDGSFKIDGLAPGTYTIEAWHETFGTKTADVTVEAGKPATVTVKYDGNEKSS
jgi:plastocyanin